MPRWVSIAWCGCSNRWSTRPQVKKIPEAYPLGYVEDFFETRTKLGACFSNRLKVADGALKNRNLLHRITGGFQFCPDLLFEVGGVPDTVDQEIEKPF